MRKHKVIVAKEKDKSHKNTINVLLKGVISPNCKDTKKFMTTTNYLYLVFQFFCKHTVVVVLEADIYLCSVPLSI